MKRLFMCILLAFSIVISPVLKITAIATEGTYYVNGVEIPVYGTDYYGKYRKFTDGAPTYGKGQCWRFANMVYRQIWGTSFTSYKGTSDDMLRNLKSDSERAITAANTKKFISAAALGATIRVTNNTSGSDSNGTSLHSMILIDKDANGFTIYDSRSSGITITYYTWQSFASAFASARYFKYIKWPSAPAYDSQPQLPSNVRLQIGETTYPLGNSVTFTAKATNATYFTLTVKKGSSTVYEQLSGFSTSLLWKPTSVGTYTANITAHNSAGAVNSANVEFTVYDGNPGQPDVKTDVVTAIAGQTININWTAGEMATSHILNIYQGNALYYSAEYADTYYYSNSYPEGYYTAEVIAVNPYGSTSSSCSFQVAGNTASGSVGKSVSWAVDTSKGLLVLSGAGATDDYMTLESWGSSSKDTPYVKYADSITHIIVGDGITRLGYGIFQQLSAVKTVELPVSLQSIGYGCFWGCNALEAIEIPINVSLIEKHAFVFCSKLSEVYFYSQELPTIQYNLNYGDTFSNCADDLQLYLLNGNYDPSFSNPYFKKGIWSYMADVKFDGQGGNCPDNPDYAWGKLVNAGQTFGELPVPVRKGFSFDGWYTAPTAGSLVTPESILQLHNFNTVHSRCVLYAHWTPLEMDITFDANGGTADKNAKTVTYWETYEDLPGAQKSEDGLTVFALLEANADTGNLSKPIYEFEGWYTAQDGGEQVSSDDLVEITQDCTLYAHWTEHRIAFQNAVIVDDAIIYEITSRDLLQEVKIIAAFYGADNQFIQCKIYEGNLGEATGTLPIDTEIDFTTCKLFVCTEDFIPICETATIQSNCTFF